MLAPCHNAAREALPDCGKNLAVELRASLHWSGLKDTHKTLNLEDFLFLGETCAGEQKGGLRIGQEVRSVLPTWNPEVVLSFPPAKELLLTQLAVT